MVKLAAGEFAAAKVREEGEQQLEAVRLAHKLELDRARDAGVSIQEAKDKQAQETQATILQQQQDRQQLESQNATFRMALAEKEAVEHDRETRILEDGLTAGRTFYRICRWAVAILFGIAIFFVARFSAVDPIAAAPLSAVIGVFGFWFVPEILDGPLSWCAMKRLRSVIAAKDASLEIPNQHPDFKSGDWNRI